MNKTLPLLLILCLSGCGPSDNNVMEIAKSEIFSQLKDPESAEFRSIRVAESHKEQDGSLIATVCGQVNGKNSLGAYVGYDNFIVMLAIKKNEHSVISSNLLKTPLELEVFNYKKECGEGK